MSSRDANDKKLRLGIFYFHDKDGVVNQYVEFLLETMMRHLDDLYIVAGKKLTSDGRGKFNKYTDIIFTNENAVDNKEGYGSLINVLGNSFLTEYDQLVLFDSNLIGPVSDLKYIFEEFESINTDFLNLLTEPGKKMSDFIICDKKLVGSFEFNNFWKNNSLDTWNSYFISKGFTGKNIIENTKYDSLNLRPWLYYPKELIKEYNCPFISAESFNMDYEEFLTESVGQATYELFKYIQDTKIYDLNLLWDYLLRHCHQSDLVKLLHLNYVLSDQVVDSGFEISKKLKIAMLIHIYRTDMAEELAEYASYMPEGTVVYITTDSQKKKEEIEEVFTVRKIPCFEVRLIENRGRDVSSKLVGVKDVIMNYDYVCCIHDKKTPHLKPQSIGEGFGYKCFKNIIPSKQYALNVIRLLEKNPRIGMVVPPEPNHGTFFTTLGLEWVGNYDTTRSLGEKLGLNVPMAVDKEPVAPFGSFFWFRPKAMKKLYDYDWKYEDFPAEPIADDATILHAVERIYPFVVQDAGYYPAVIMAESYARIEFTNLKYYVRGYNRTLAAKGIINSFKMMRSELEKSLEEKNEMFAVIQLYEAQIRELNKQLQDEKE